MNKENYITLLTILGIFFMSVLIFFACNEFYRPLFQGIYDQGWEKGYVYCQLVKHG